MNSRRSKLYKCTHKESFTKAFFFYLQITRGDVTVAKQISPGLPETSLLADISSHLSRDPEAFTGQMSYIILLLRSGSTTGSPPCWMFL